jgi:DNA (cytosine-5)-methyltransferase 1
MNVYYNEIDKHCVGVLKKHVGDGTLPMGFIDERSIEEVTPDGVRKYRQCHFFAGIGGFPLGFKQAGLSPSVNVWTGGFPCQDLSVAGNRKGLAGGRSGLWFEFHRLLSGVRPDWVVIENVPGLLSSWSPVEPPPFQIPTKSFDKREDAERWANSLRGEWEVEEASDFETITTGLVELGYGVCWKIFDAQYFNLAQRRRRVFVVGHLGDGRAAEVLFESESGAWNPAPSRETGTRVAGTLTSRFGKNGGSANDDVDSGRVIAFGGNNTSGPIDVATAVNAHGSRRYDFESETFVTAYTIQTNDGGNHKRQDRPNGGMYVSEAETALTMGSSDQTVIAFDCRNLADTKEITHSLQSKKSGGYSLNYQPVIAVPDPAYALADNSGNRTGSGRDVQDTFILQTGVRRLTPTECERLQDFPDGWTGDQSDTQQYKQLGNAVAVAVIKWIGERIEKC